jgi:hypothetical protein
MNLSLKKVGSIAFVAGFGVALSIEILARCLDAMNIHPGLWLSTVVICLWPAGLALNETSHNWAGYVAFFITAICNGLLYALAVVLVVSSARFVKNG